MAGRQPGAALWLSVMLAATACGGGGVSVGPGVDDIPDLPGGPTPGDDPVRDFPLSAPLHLTLRLDTATTILAAAANDAKGATTQHKKQSDELVATFSVVTASVTLAAYTVATSTPVDCAAYAAAASAAAATALACAGNTLTLVGPFTIDLLSGAATPSLPEVVLPATYITGISAAFAPGNDDALLAQGVLNANDASTPVRLRLAPNGNLDFALAAPVPVASDTLTLDLALSLDTWFAGSGEPLLDCRDSSQAVYDGPTLVIDVTQNGGGICNRIRGLLQANLIQAGITP